ncbi:hypothetical protein [Streptomyces sp. NPDC058698]|uniref:hypothetical protein n=1 Tax=Streptomyces sp. NPDC058698 TaxID=3346606 RepID=UPI00365474C4
MLIWFQVCPVRRSATRADQQQREPAQQHVGPDTVFETVEDRPQLQHRFQITKSALGFQESLVADHDLLGTQVRIGAGQQVLAVQTLLGLDLGAVDGQPSVLRCSQPPFKVGCEPPRFD